MLLFITIIFEGAGLLVMGVPAKDEDILEAIEKHRKDGIRVNSINGTILYVGDMPFIAKHFQLLGNYYIDRNVGIIPRWYKSHKLIKKLFDEYQPKKLVTSKRKELKLN